MAARYVRMAKVEGGDEEPEFRTAGKPRCLRCSVILLILLLILAVAAATTFAVLFFLGIGKSTSSEVCTSDACSRLANRMREAMNQSADPCEDFYNFACGNWVSRNNFTSGDDGFCECGALCFINIPDYYSSDIFTGILEKASSIAVVNESKLTGYGTLELQRRVVYGELADVLESDFTSNIAALVKVETLYKSCTNIEAIESSGWAPLWNLYKEIGGWSLVNIPGDGSTWGINSTQFVKEKMLLSPAFYKVGVVLDESTSSKYVLEISQSGLSENAANYFNETFTEQLEELIYFALSELAGETSYSILDASENIVTFETNLAEIWKWDYQTEDNSIVLSVQNLSQLWPGYNWIGTLQQLFEPSGVIIDPTQSVVVKNPDYFTNLTQLIMDTPEETLENYAKWQLFRLFFEVLPRSSEFLGHLRDFRKFVLGKATYEQRLGCVDLVQKILPLALGRVYADHILQPGTREVVRNFVYEVKSGLRQRMTTRDWLDDTTRHLSIEKLNAIYAMIAYPNQTTNDTYLNMRYAEYNFNVDEFIDNYIQFLRVSQVQDFSLLTQPVDRTQWIEAPTDINAYYYAPFNHIVVLEGILHLPTFDDDWPIYVQYGGLGSILGHEFTHGFDNHGRLYDKNGVKRQWWTNASIEEFTERAQCFVEQYSKYEMFGYNINGNLTLGENIADNGGLKASFGAYRKATNQHSTIPGLKGLDYTEDQLFFIAFSQVWCSYDTPTSFRTQVLTDEHSPNMFRVIGSLVNNPDFAEVFSCPVQSPMNPENKCLLW